MTVLLFGATSFLSAMLLFLVEPLVGRMILPRFGGSAAVWTTCLMAFQALLLLSYLCAHLLARLPRRAHRPVHLALLLGGAATLPLRLPVETTAVGGSPRGDLIRMLLSCVGVSFFALAANAPTLQRWFAATTHERRHDPYFLYGVSNAGSLTGLLLYPLVLEPFLSVTQHRWIWSAGYLLLLVLMTAVASIGRVVPDDTSRGGSFSAPPPWRRVAWWVALAFVPSSLTLGCTEYLSRELAPIPLLWVLPLALYLLTFVSSFSGHVIRPTDKFVRWAALVGLIGATAHVAGRTSNAVGIALHLGALFLLCALCHGKLSDSRPTPEHLTGFYLWLSLGGVLGGLFNALVAPIAFHTALEYPLVLVLASLAIVGGQSSPWPRRASLTALLPVAAAVVWLAATGVPHPSVALLVPLGALTLGVFRRNTVRLAACGIGAVLFVELAVRSWTDRPIVARSFYSVLRVVDNYEPGYRALIHGATVHGMQAYDPVAARRAVTYYAASGPVGQLFSAFGPRLRGGAVGVVGLGVGEMAAYAQAGQQWTFFEIDPLVARMATRYFSYLRNAPTPPRVVIGDGRKSLANVPAYSLDLLVLDAFSSDAIPVHLLTAEAMELYWSRLLPGGILAVHISNRFVDLQPLLAGTARASGVCAYHQFAPGSPQQSPAPHRRPAHWVVLARSCEVLAPLTGGPWSRLSGGPHSLLWTDERADLLSVVRWSDVMAVTTR